MARTADARPLTVADVQAIALALPGVEEGVAYGTPAFRVRKRFLARLDGDALVLKVDPERRAALVAADPVTFEITDHLRAHPYVRVRLETAGRAEVAELFAEAWRREAPARLVRLHDSETA